MTLEVPQLFIPPTTDLSTGAPSVLKELIFAIFLQTSPSTTANHVVPKAFLFMLVEPEPPFCGFRHCFALSCFRMGKSGEAPSQRSVLVILPGCKRGDSKGVYGTCESGKPK